MREIRRDDDGALLGFVRPVGEAWEPVTVFGYPLGEPCSEEEAFDEVHRTGLEVLMRRWEFLEDGEWYRCVILEAAAREVRIQPNDHRYPHNVYALTLERPEPGTFVPSRVARMSERPTALVTGASGGSGPRSPHALAPTHDLLLGGRDAEGLAKVCDGLPGARPWPVELTSVTEADVAGIDRLDVLVHSAGVMARGGSRTPRPRSGGARWRPTWSRWPS